MLSYYQAMWWTGIDAAKAEGFTGFQTIEKLRASKLEEVPKKPGVYLILRPPGTSPVFAAVSCGGHFKGKNPSVECSLLLTKWVADVAVIYVGKAGGGNNSTLHSRLKAYLQFGEGKPVGHWGGRYIWQIEQNHALLVAWKVLDTDVPLAVEQRMLDEFSARFLKLPFANCRR